MPRFLYKALGFASLIWVFPLFIFSQQLENSSSLSSSPTSYKVSAQQAAQSLNSGTSGGTDLAAPKDVNTASLLKEQKQDQAPEKSVKKSSSKSVQSVTTFDSFFSQSSSTLDVTLTSTPFGHEFFSEESTFSNTSSGPVGSDYILGPGDSFKVLIWGRFEVSLDVTVDRDGRILLPKVGPLFVSGLQYSELKPFLVKQLSQYYSSFDLSVSMTTLKSIRVYVVGHAAQPGAYQISSLSTLINTLFQCGGPSKSGSMRKIEVKRNGQVLTTFSLYDFIMFGDKSKDVRLMPEDVVYIHPVGPQIAVAGFVKRPAVYELDTEKTAKDVIALAGGTTDFFYKGRLQVGRVMDNKSQTFFETDFDKLDQLTVQPGDILKIYPVAQSKSSVVVSGAVHRPGEYAYKPGMRLKELIDFAGGVVANSLLKDVELTRVKVTESGPDVIRKTIDLTQLGSQSVSESIAVEPGDMILVHTVPEWEVLGSVEVQGEVRFPGIYSVKKGEKLSSVLKRAGGYSTFAYLPGASFFRPDIRLVQQDAAKSFGDNVYNMTDQNFLAKRELLLNSILTDKSLGRLSLNFKQLSKMEGSSDDITMMHGDKIHIPKNPEVVYVVGSVFNKQGAFAYSENKSPEEYIAQAAGYLPTADKDNAYVYHADGSSEKFPGTFLFFFKGSYPKIQPGDIIVVPEDYRQEKSLKDIMNITQTVYQIAVSLATVVYLLR